MATINPYLNFNGNAELAFNFYKSVFGGEFIAIQRFKDMPSAEMSETDGQKIMHISLPISKETVLMGSDVPSSYPQSVFGTNISLSVNPDSEAETERIFNALSAGGKIGMPLAKAFWGAYFGMCTDQFGIHWMVNYTL